MTRLAARLAAVGAGLCLVGGCGDDDGGSGGGSGSSQKLKDAVAKTEAAGTARMSVEIAIEGPESARYKGEGWSISSTTATC